MAERSIKDMLHSKGQLMYKVTRSKRNVANVSLNRSGASEDILFNPYVVIENIIRNFSSRRYMIYSAPSFGFRKYFMRKILSQSEELHLNCTEIVKCYEVQSLTL